MKILITGVTETHTNHEVDHRAVVAGEDLSMYQKVFIYLYPVDHNAVNVDGAIWALQQRPEAWICLDDWSFQKLLPTWGAFVDTKLLTSRTWLAPLFPWGDVKAMGLPVDDIRHWDPSSLYFKFEQPKSNFTVWDKRKTEWYNASLSKEAHEWAIAQDLQWPIHSVGGKALGQPRILESQIVWEYGTYKGVLCPTYAHAGCGWWRVRYLHAAIARSILGSDPKETGMVHPAYGYSLKEIEKMSDEAREYLAWLQADAIVQKLAPLHETVEKIKGWLT